MTISPSKVSSTVLQNSIAPGSLVALLGFLFLLVGGPSVRADAPQPSIQAQKIQPSEAKSLQKEFERTQKKYRAYLEKKQNEEWNRFKADLKARRKTFHENEKSKRHQYFAQHPNGQDRREFMKEFKLRRDAMEKEIESDLERKRQSQLQERKQTDSEQSTALQEFKQFIQRGEKPPESLWPKPHSPQI